MSSRLLFAIITRVDPDLTNRLAVENGVDVPAVLRYALAYAKRKLDLHPATNGKKNTAFNSN